MESNKSQISDDIDGDKQEVFGNFSHGITQSVINAPNRTFLYQDSREKLLRLMEKSERFQKIIESIEEKEKKIVDLEERKNQIRMELKQIRDNLKEKKENVISIKNRIEEFSFNSFNKSIEKLMELIENPTELKLQNIRGKIFGTIGNLCKINSEYSKPLRIAGGDMLNYVIVDNEKTINQCINYLKKNKLPPVGFIPLNNIRNYPFNVDLKRNNKVIGRAIDLIEYDPMYKNAFEFVFGRTIIVADVNTALHFQVNAKRVTLDGDIIEPSNIIKGGYENRQKKIIKNQIKKKKIDSLENEITFLRDKENSCENQLKEVEFAINLYFKENLKFRGITK